MLVLAGVKFFTVAGAVFGVCAGNSVDNIRIILLLLSRTYAESGSFSSSPHPTRAEAGGAQGVGRGLR